MHLHAELQQKLFGDALVETAEKDRVCGLLLRLTLPARSHCTRTLGQDALRFNKRPARLQRAAQVVSAG